MKIKGVGTRFAHSARITTFLLVASILAVGLDTVAFAASPPTVISEAFTQNSGTLAPVSGGTWLVDNGTYNLTVPAVAETGNGNVSISSTPLTGDFTITVDGKALSQSGEYSVIFDYSDPQNYSYAHFSATLHDFSQGVFKVQAGVVSQVAAYDSAVASGSLQTVKVKYESGKIKVYKGTTYLNGLTMSVRAGAKVGLGTASSAASFDNLSVAGTVASTPIAPLPQVTPQPPVTPPAAPTSCSSFQALRTVPVATSSDLTAALTGAQAGDDIQLANGTYNGNFVIATSGTATQPIRLSGSAAAILDAGSVDGSPVLRLNHASNWCVDGLSITNGNKGIMADFATDNVLQNLDVYNIGDEAVHFRSCSSNNVIQDSHIYMTGQRRDSFGEGVYLGTADSNWGVYNYCDLGNPDQSNYNRVLRNTFDGTTAEAVDVKEGTMGGVIEGNHFDGAGMSGNHADSLIDVKGANYTISGNTAVVTGPSAVIDGFQTHVIAVRTDVTRSGTGNVFSGNTVALGSASGYGFRIGNGSTALVTCDNVVTGAALGMSNIACRP